ncbi:MAG: AmmeMemoRadiSam system protein B [Terriglobia bacterium]
MIRKPAVAGQFYPAQKEVLLEEVTRFLESAHPKVKAEGILVPHAGYMYSGHVAGAVYASIEIPPRVIILCPNHTGMGASLAIMSSGFWEIPLGKVEIDNDLAKRLMHHCHLLSEDAEAHRFEHSLEVQLPFLYTVRKDFKFVPIAVGTGGYASLERLGKAIETVRQEVGGELLVVASSDMNHYESDQTTRVKDRAAINKILELNPKGLYEVIKSESISMCGYGPAIIMMHSLDELPARKAELVKYATSGDISGDRRQVVGYAGIVVQ